MPKPIEDQLPHGASSKYSCSQATTYTYVNKARQIAHAGPGLSEFEVPLVPNLSTGEVDRFIVELSKTYPNDPVRILRSTAGIGVFVQATDHSWRPPTPTRVDTSKFEGAHKQLWEVCREQADYVSGKDTNNHSLPDCSSGCQKFIRLDGKLGSDWGVCSEPRSPRAGLLTFEHMGCSFFAKKG
jgi:hypothetical protein